MELHTMVDDFFVTASLALLLTFLVAKLVEAMNGIHTAPKHHVHSEPVPLRKRFKVQRAQSKSKVGFISPVQAATCVGTQHNIEEAKVEPIPTVKPAQSKSLVEVATCVRPESKIEEEATVESNSNFVVESPVKSDLDTAVEEEIAEANEGTAQQIEVPVIENIIKENDHHDDDDDDDDDDWEGIERSELEKEFMAATEFASEDNRLESVGSNVRMELYGLHKVATEGPCRDPYPMSLKLFARAKNVWQKLGNMSPEIAMEQYISLLSDKFPGWMKDTSDGMSKHDESTRPEVSDSASDSSTTLSHQEMIITKRELEQESDSKDCSSLTESDLEND
ncbi:Acyl-CoA-binding domain-containing protein 3, partial [Mucuna pruriens]